MLTIYECPRCGRVSDGEARRGVCAGAVYDDTSHVATEMREVRVFREEDVRPLWATLRVVAAEPDADAQTGAAFALGKFAAPEEWTGASDAAA